MLALMLMHSVEAFQSCFQLLFLFTIEMSTVSKPIKQPIAATSVAVATPV